MIIKIPTYKGFKHDKISCLNCEKIIDKTDSSIEITVTVWINGYMQVISASNFFCNDCSAKGFDIKPLIEDDDG